MRVKRDNLDAVLSSAPLFGGEQYDASMCRDAGMLEKLRSTGVPLASVRALCKDSEVLGSTLLVMDRVPGVSIVTNPPA